MFNSSKKGEFYKVQNFSVSDLDWRFFAPILKVIFQCLKVILNAEKLLLKRGDKYEFSGLFKGL